MGTTPGGCLQTQDHPELKISALCLAQGAPVKTDVFDDVWFTYFFNESNHKAGIPTPDFVTYHFCERLRRKPACCCCCCFCSCWCCIAAAAVVVVVGRGAAACARVCTCVCCCVVICLRVVN